MHLHLSRLHNVGIKSVPDAEQLPQLKSWIARMVQFPCLSDASLHQSQYWYAALIIPSDLSARLELQFLQFPDHGSHRPSLHPDPDAAWLLRHGQRSYRLWYLPEFDQSLLTDIRLDLQPSGYFWNHHLDQRVLHIR